MNKNMLDAAMLQLLATQMMTQQAAVSKMNGWRRQTCIRSIAASGVRGDVVYYAPCGKKLSTYAEVLRYLMKHPCGSISRDNFSFSSKLIVGEFLMPKETENGEKTVVKMSEDVIAEEVNRLVSLKPQPRNGERKHKEKPEKTQEKQEKEGRATPEEPQEQNHHVEVEESPLEVYDDEDKIKWSREPIDDLLLTEIRPVPDLPRVENLRLNGVGFADALMVHEFVHNFAHVLEIDRSTLPSLGAFCAGLVGDANHFDKVIQLTQSLFRLSLEYPGLPAGKRGRTRLGQTISELGVTNENYSELMRMFLATRDSQGQKLSDLLVEHSFAELSGEEKASILAYLCNELLCCPNIVKEIDRNLEEVGRLKGDRWMRDGKARALRVVQRRKQKAERGLHTTSESEGQTHDERPSSRNSEASDTSRPATPIPTTRDRRLTPGLGQCEILTEEEENMSPEQLEVLIDSLNSEAEHLKEKINALSTKVRSFPLGCDRYHRQYWQIPGVESILVESIESSGPSNPACNTEETCTKDPPGLTAPSFLDPDVFACVEDLVDDVVTGRSHTDRRKRKRFRRMDNPYKRGWWSVDIELDKVGDEVDWKNISELDRNAVHRRLDELEARISKAKIAARMSANGHLRGGDKSLDELRQRILFCERRINRNYLRPSFCVGDKKCLAYSLKMENGTNKKDSHHPEDEDERSEADKDDEGADDMDRDDSDTGEMIDRWRSFVESVDTPAELALAVQSPPSREWFCPACVETSTQVPTCLICSRQLDELVTCRKCYHFFHAECASDASYDYNGDFLCRGCDPKLFERRVIAHGECDDYVEVDDAADSTEHHHHGHHPNGHHPTQGKDVRKPVKRKADAPPPIVFPTDMNADLCRAMLDELECQPGVGPFLEPVDLDLVPGYREAIANPIDMASIRNRIEAQWLVIVLL
ncbi:Methyl-CpG binding domain protein [Ancylostoma ceylanicum]|uniref:Methyl-CpG binding domain protein n=1 Tax=Ancylostoma ceylanicum TaxID=53326 RepID=A0A0D6MA05_9BILA|nr:Methyl-CpG binding domain protein [Ancylostoma ceylanicum]